MISSEDLALEQMVRDDGDPPTSGSRAWMQLEAIRFIRITVTYTLGSRGEPSLLKVTSHHV